MPAGIVKTRATILIFECHRGESFAPELNLGGLKTGDVPHVAIAADLFLVDKFYV